MTGLISEFIDKIVGSFNWVWRQITLDVSWYENYFYGLIIISLLVYALELIFPWRKHQKPVRKDFWMDTFYMFFNFFIFASVIEGFYAVTVYLIGDYSNSIAIFNPQNWPVWSALLVFFILNDFVQWFTHVLLHRFEFLWQFHKVHHSVKEMGYAAHLRYHWMENIFYKPLKTLVIVILGGFNIEQAFIIHFISIAIGHLNHANIKITWGPLKYIFNNSVMHLWHHAKNLPAGRKHGMNYGISLSLWDYIFGTNYIPHESGDIELGFENDEQFPKSNLWRQLIYPIQKKD
ncbi:MAG: sterol desaturase family protein [Crocinitomicaceae bacterium]